MIEKVKSGDKLTYLRVNSLSCDPGWIFPKSKIDTVKQILNIK